MAGCKKTIDQIKTIDAAELSDIYDDIFPRIIDVGKQSEFESAHVENAINIPLDNINESFAQINKNEPTYVHCAGVYRSMIFISILKARGYDNLINVNGGFGAIRNTGLYSVFYNIPYKQH